MNTTIKVGSWNVRVIRARNKVIHDFMEENQVDIMAVQETLLSKSYHLPTSYRYDAVMNATNDTGWAPGGSAIIFSSNTRLLEQSRAANNY